MSTVEILAFPLRASDLKVREARDDRNHFSTSL